MLFGDRTAHDVGTSGSGLVAFLGVGAGVAGVSMSNTVSVGPAVARRIRSHAPVGAIAASPPSATTPGCDHKLVTEGLDLVSEGGVGSDKRGVRGNELLEVGLLVGGSAGAVFQGIDDGVQEARVEGVGFRG